MIIYHPESNNFREEFPIRHTSPLQQSCRIVAATLQECCSNIAGTLPQYFVETLPNVAVTLQKYCRNVVVQYCNATLMHLCSNNSVSVPCNVAWQRRSNIGTSTLRCNHATLQGYSNDPATLPPRCVLYGSVHNQCSLSLKHNLFVALRHSKFDHK